MVTRGDFHFGLYHRTELFAFGNLACFHILRLQFPDLALSYFRVPPQYAHVRSHFYLSSLHSRSDNLFVLGAAECFQDFCSSGYLFRFYFRSMSQENSREPFAHFIDDIEYFHSYFVSRGQTLCRSVDRYVETDDNGFLIAVCKTNIIFRYGADTRGNDERLYLFRFELVYFRKDGLHAGTRVRLDDKGNKGNSTFCNFALNFFLAACCLLLATVSLLLVLFSRFPGFVTSGVFFEGDADFGQDIPADYS